MTFKHLKSAKLFLLNQALLILIACLYLICCLLNFRGNVIDLKFLPIKLPPVHGPPFFYKSTHIALDEIHRGNCSGLMVRTSKILGIGSPPMTSGAGLKGQILKLCRFKFAALN